jgi:raffinose/stachyose/melibiose transport system substrate-binding protein
MQRKTSWSSLIFLVIISLVIAACAQSAQPDVTDVPAVTEPPAEAESVTLTLGNWRPDDVKQMQVILDEFHKDYPNITIKFDPTNPPDYDAAVRTQMEAGTGADLYYLRSLGSGASHRLYDEGHFLAIDGLPGLENIIPAAIANWTAKDGKVFGVGYIATSEGIYYNQDIFTELGLPLPTTWDELLVAAQAFQDAGYIPFANASGDSWTVPTLLLQNWIPMLIGGEDGRLSYVSGENCLNDTDFTQAFQMLKDISPYLPEGQAALTYYDSQQLFLQGQAVMWFGGSWDIPVFEDAQPEFKWSIMPVPPVAGKESYFEFELDAGVGINSATKYPDEAKIFMSWLTTKKSAELLAGNLPGFFPMTNDEITLDNEYANAFLTAIAASKGSDVRFYMNEGVPDSTTLMTDNGIAVLKGEMTPEEAANSLYEGISTWSEAQQNCTK